ncbi:hypothetical protein HK101_010680 [Irineochytrium annulatum]|nr:hypothetical protein HK101_010680 [Irineochytrium annulatum]
MRRVEEGHARLAAVEGRVGGSDGLETRLRRLEGKMEEMKARGAEDSKRVLEAVMQVHQAVSRSKEDQRESRELFERELKEVQIEMKAQCNGLRSEFDAATRY